MRLTLYIIFVHSAFTSDKGTRPNNITENDQKIICSSKENIEAAIISSIAQLLTDINKENISGNKTLSSKRSTFINNLNVGIQNRKADSTQNSTFSNSRINRKNYREKIYLNDFVIYFIIIGIFFSIVLISVILYIVLVRFNRRKKPSHQHSEPTYFSPSDKYSETSGLATQIVQEQTCL